MHPAFPSIDVLPTGKTWSLGPVRTLAGRVGLPLEAEYVHVVGTNGKGSTAAFLASMLQAQGYRTALYTSPHLARPNERIRVDGKEIPNTQLDQLAQELLPHLKRLKREGHEASPFEAFTILALQYFEQTRAQVVVLEAGLGGRLDATNIGPGKTAVVTSIGLEHEKLLGHTLSAIAREKAGVIKEKASVVSGVREKSPSAVLQSVCRRQHAGLFELGEDFSASGVRASLQETVFDYQGLRQDFPALKASLLGSHQARNAACAVAATECLADRGFPVNETAVRAGLLHTAWPARLEVLSRKPLVIVDGAHNPHGARALTASLEELLPPGRKVRLVYGTLKDKNYAGVVAALAPRVSNAILTKPESERALSPEKLAPYFHERGVPCTVVASIGDALEKALAETSASDVLLVCGSLYLVGPARQRLIKRLRRSG